MSESTKILELNQPFISVPGEVTVAGDHDKPQAEASYTSTESALTDLLRIITETQADPISKFSGFLITEEPTYLPDTDDARALARRIGRDKLLEALIQSYLETHEIKP